MYDHASSGDGSAVWPVRLDSDVGQATEKGYLANTTKASIPISKLSLIGNHWMWVHLISAVTDQGIHVDS